MGKPTEAAEDIAPQTPLVLIIDDDAGLRYVLQEVFRHHGYTVATADSAEEAEQAKQRVGPKAISVVVVDVHLTPNPRFQEGYALYQQWTHLYPHLPFLLISGVANSQHLPAIANGDVAFLAKPFTMESLLEEVKRLIKNPK